jgi:hypothetical protein
MKTRFFALLSLCLLIGCESPTARPKDEPLVWCGLDYSKVKMFGTLDFRQPDQIFPGMIVQWNGLFNKEMLSELEHMTKIVYTDTDAVMERNQHTGANQIERRDGTKSEMVNLSHITEPEIAEMVRSYKLKNTSGLGLVFVMDRLVKNQAQGCMYVVFFDVGSRNVLHSERACAEASGGGFRNYWFTPIKEVVGNLPGIYERARSAKPASVVPHDAE